MGTHKAGQSTREMANQRRKTGIIVLVGALIVIIIIGIILSNAKTLGIGGGAILFLLFLPKIIEVITENYDKKSIQMEKRANRGAKAEEEIGGLLSELDEEQFLVLHDINSTYGNIDHLVLCQRGIFLIETKSHHGKVSLGDGKLLINGHEPEKDFIAQTLKNSYWLKELIKTKIGLDVWINPLLVFTNAFVPFGKPIKGVQITNKKFLLNILQSNGRVTASNQKLWEVRDKLGGLF
jgi:hypothetical protein